ncbi:MAG TPA: histidine phosphatase family protein [Candidatus Babeliaceae bacterium]|nr:histidine phosphatase family protein [Candidatus Babeliaceae bacterium]
MNKPTRFLFIRHGQTDWNVNRRWQGHIDTTLNETGRQQAEKLAQLLFDQEKNLDAIYTSDLQRAHATAEIIGKKFACTVKSDCRLREMHLGDAQGLFAHEVEQRFNVLRNGFDHIPNSESMKDVVDRVHHFLSEIALRHHGKTALVVTHKAVIKSLITHAGSHGEPTNCSVSVFEYNSSLQLPLLFLGIQHIV